MGEREYARMGGRPYGRAVSYARGYYTHGAEAPDFDRAYRPRVDVVPGRRMRPDIVTLPSSVIASVAIVLVAAAIVAAFAMVRVTLTAESVSMSMEADSVAAQIDSARTLGNDLEVQQSRLANATIIRSQASRLGMAAPVATSVVTLDDDVVSTDSDGNLSLSGSIEAIAARG